MAKKPFNQFSMTGFVVVNLTLWLIL